MSIFRSLGTAKLLNITLLLIGVYLLIGIFILWPPIQIAAQGTHSGDHEYNNMWARRFLNTINAIFT